MIYFYLSTIQINSPFADGMYYEATVKQMASFDFSSIDYNNLIRFLPLVPVTLLFVLGLNLTLSFKVVAFMGLLGTCYLVTRFLNNKISSQLLSFFLGWLVLIAYWPFLYNIHNPWQLTDLFAYPLLLIIFDFYQKGKLKQSLGLAFVGILIKENFGFLFLGILIMSFKEVLNLLKRSKTIVIGSLLFLIILLYLQSFQKFLDLVRYYAGIFSLSNFYFYQGRETLFSLIKELIYLTSPFLFVTICYLWIDRKSMFRYFPFVLYFIVSFIISMFVSLREETFDFTSRLMYPSFVLIHLLLMQKTFSTQKIEKKLIIFSPLLLLFWGTSHLSFQDFSIKPLFFLPSFSRHLIMFLPLILIFKRIFKNP